MPIFHGLKNRTVTVRDHKGNEPRWSPMPAVILPNCNGHSSATHTLICGVDHWLVIGWTLEWFREGGALDGPRERAEVVGAPIEQERGHGYRVPIRVTEP